jgi:hypothetical protein
MGERCQDDTRRKVVRWRDEVEPRKLCQTTWLLLVARRAMRERLDDNVEVSELRASCGKATDTRQGQLFLRMQAGFSRQTSPECRQCRRQQCSRRCPPEDPRRSVRLEAAQLGGAGVRRAVPAEGGSVEVWRAIRRPLSAYTLVCVNVNQYDCALCRYFRRAKHFLGQLLAV